jgi:hypothetical protein
MRLGLYICFIMYFAMQRVVLEVQRRHSVGMIAFQGEPGDEMQAFGAEERIQVSARLLQPFNTHHHRMQNSLFKPALRGGQVHRERVRLRCRSCIQDEQGMK